jgi:hypothetical protein
MFLDNLGEIIASETVELADHCVQKIKIKILQQIEKEGIMKSIIFKHGFLITIYSLKTFDTMAYSLATEYANSFNTGVAPDLKGRFDFGVSAFCMKLDTDAKCKIDNSPCEYARTRQWPKCEYIFKSIQEDLEKKKR